MKPSSEVPVARGTHSPDAHSRSGIGVDRPGTQTHAEHHAVGSTKPDARRPAHKLPVTGKKPGDRNA